jgi:hypothetical protein
MNTNNYYDQPPPPPIFNEKKKGVDARASQDNGNNLHATPRPPATTSTQSKADRVEGKGPEPASGVMLDDGSVFKDPWNFNFEEPTKKEKLESPTYNFNEFQFSLQHDWQFAALDQFLKQAASSGYVPGSNLPKPTTNQPKPPAQPKPPVPTKPSKPPKQTYSAVASKSKQPGSVWVPKNQQSTKPIPKKSVPRLDPYEERHVRGFWQCWNCFAQNSNDQFVCVCGHINYKLQRVKGKQSSRGSVASRGSVPTNKSQFQFHWVPKKSKTVSNKSKAVKAPSNHSRRKPKQFVEPPKKRKQYIERKQAGGRSKRQNQRNTFNRMASQYKQHERERNGLTPCVDCTALTKGYRRCFLCHQKHKDRGSATTSTSSRKSKQKPRWVPKRKDPAPHLPRSLPSVPFFLEKNELEFFNNAFGEHLNGTERHDHALPAAVRWAAQLKAEQYIRDRHKCVILDMWGSARLPAPDKWSWMPIKTHSDHLRRLPDRHCRCHKLKYCNHVPTPHVKLMVDSVYYTDVNNISGYLQTSDRGCLYTLHHPLKGVVGSSMVGTYRWKTSGDETQVFVGNTRSHPNQYTHKSTSWLYKQSTWNYGWKNPRNFYCFTYEPIAFYGDMEFGVFIGHQGPGTAGTKNIKTAPNTRVLPVVRDDLAARVLSPFVELTKDKHITVDQKLVDHIRKWMIGRVLNMATRRECENMMKRWASVPQNVEPYSHAMDLLPTLIENSIALVFATATPDVHNAYRGGAKDMIKHNDAQALAFQPPRSIFNRRTMMAGAVFAGGVAYKRWF